MKVRGALLIDPSQRRQPVHVPRAWRARRRGLGALPAHLAAFPIGHKCMGISLHAQYLLNLIKVDLMDKGCAIV